jgi:hypothetical protein
MSFWIKLSVFSGICRIAPPAPSLDSLNMTLLESPIDIFCQLPLISVHPSNHPAVARFVCFERAGLHSLRKNSGFVSGYRFSDNVSPSKSDAPLGAETAKSIFSATSSAVSQASHFHCGFTLSGAAIFKSSRYQPPARRRVPMLGNAR